LQMGGHARSSVRYTTPAKDSPRGALSGVPSPPASAQLRAYRRRKGEAKGFTWTGYRDLIIATHHNLSAPLVWC